MKALMKMNLNSEYGILIKRSEDKKFVKNFNEIFERSMSKSKSKSMLEARLPYVYKYFYFSFIKAKGLFIEMVSNEDEEGRFIYPDRQDFGWILKTRVRDDFEHVNVEEVLSETRMRLDTLDYKLEFISHKE